MTESSTELLVWGPKLATGIKAIDDQHMILVEMTNDANRKLKDAVDKPLLMRMVRDLMNYALYHFDTEEELMASHGYLERHPDDAARHNAEHRDFSETVAQLHQALVRGELITREHLVGFLNHWLVNHILHTDMRLAAFLQQHGTPPAG